MAADVRSLIKAYLVRIPIDEAPIKNEACFWTEDVMSWWCMQVKMRDHRDPVN